MSNKPLVLAFAGALLLAGCAAPAATPSPTTPVAASSSAPTESTQLRVITHDSFALSKDVIAAFKAETGYDVVFNAPGDAGTVVNQLVLTKSAPIADVVFGIDNTFAGRAFGEDVLSPYTSAALPAGADQYAADDSARLTPIDYGDVCLNADSAWFTAKGLAVPATLDDLLKPEYRNLLVVANPATSSPGLAFLLATIAAKGEDGYLDYWKALRDNGLKVVKGWTEAYTVEFSGSSGKGKYPLVLSYASSPAFEPATQSLNQTCFRQIEYAGVVAGSANQVGAGKFIDFLLSSQVQAEIPDQMYMYPVDGAVKLPKDWAAHAVLPEHPFTLPATQISAGRDGWIKAWTAAVIG
jgi:ABC transporter periplasmic binding protein, thiB subfamily